MSTSMCKVVRKNGSRRARSLLQSTKTLFMHVTEVANIDVKQETSVGHGEVICFSIYSGNFDAEADFGNGKTCIWVDVLDGGRDVLMEFAPFLEDPLIRKGSAADVAMCAMLEIDRDTRLKELSWRLLSQVHDEVILEGPAESADLAKAIVVECFYRTNFLKVDLSADAKCAQN